MTKPYRVHQKYYAPLELVATVTTVAELWRRSYTGVIYAIDAENIAARKCGKTWLVSLPSVVAYWGLPPCPSEDAKHELNAVAALQLEEDNGHWSGEYSRAAGSVAASLHGLRDNFFE